MKKQGARLLLALLAFAGSCEERDGHRRAERTIRVEVRGPGTVLVGARRCAHRCEFTVPLGKPIELALVPRRGANLESSNACDGVDRCQVDGEEASPLEVVVGFAWRPLKLPEAYRFRRMGTGPFFLNSLDSYGNAVGTLQWGEVVRYDAATDAFAELPFAAHGGTPHVLADSGDILIGLPGELPIVLRNGVAETVGLPGPLRCYGRDLSEAEAVVGVLNTPPTPSVKEIGTWLQDRGGARRIGADQEFGEAINSSGQIVGTRIVLEPSPLPGFNMAVAYAIEMGDWGSRLLDLGPQANVNDLSDTGLVVGTRTTGEARSRAFTYDLATDAASYFEPLGGDLSIGFSKVDPSGTVTIGVAGEPSGRSRGIVYQSGRVANLDELVLDLPAGARIPAALAVNACGQIAAYLSVPGEAASWTVLLTPDTADDRCW